MITITNALPSHLRDYSLDEKPITISFDGLWKSIDPILNLGYEQTETPEIADDNNK